MPHVHHGVMESGGFPVLLFLTIAFVALAYVRGWIRLRSIAPNSVPAWRGGSFLLGLSLIWVAVASPVAALDHELLTVHMIQHLLLMSLAPALIWLGLPVMPLWQGLPQGFVQRVISPVFGSPPVQQLGRLLAQPAFGWLAATAVLVGWHVPAAFMLAVKSGTWHLIEHASFLVAGLLFWWPVIQPWPSGPRWPEWSILLYLFLATLPCDILSAFLVFCDRVVYPIYFSSSRLLGFSALGDQQCAGALMWTSVTIIYLLAGTIFTIRLLSTQGSREDGLVQPESSLNAAQLKDPRRVEAA